MVRLVKCVLETVARRIVQNLLTPLSKYLEAKLHITSGLKPERINKRAEIPCVETQSYLQMVMKTRVFKRVFKMTNNRE